jgi:hypothetical protein
MVDKDGELVWKAFAQNLGWSRHLLFQNHLILRLCILGLHVLPGQDPSQKVHYHISNRFYVIPSRLLYSHVSVDAGISCGAC